MFPQSGAAQLQVAIDYPAALALRQMATLVDDLLHFMTDLRRKILFTTLCIPLERRSEIAGRMELVRLWEITDRTARTRLNEAVSAAAS